MIVRAASPDVSAYEPTRPRFFLDLGVPRDIDPSIAAMPDVRVADIDDLRQALAERAHATAGQALTPGSGVPVSAFGLPETANQAGQGFALRTAELPPISARFQFEGGIAVEANAAIPVASVLRYDDAENPTATLSTMSMPSAAAIDTKSSMFPPLGPSLHSCIPIADW